MSPPSSKKTPSPAGQSPTPDVFVGLLFVAVAALITGCIFLALELQKYNWEVAG